MVGLYIHFPFCISKCHYCAFNSQTNMFDFVPEYLAAMKNQLIYYVHEYNLRSTAIDTIYIGGGTPSLLSNEQVTFIFSMICEYFVLDNVNEVTIEVNPGSIELSKVKCWKDLGINRVSLGTQSFDQSILNYLGRTHNVQQINDSVCLCRENGITNISLDLISGVCGYDHLSWQTSLEQIKKISPEHLSIYELTIEEGTYLGSLQNYEFPLLSENEQITLMKKTKKYLQELDYHQYEISSFSKKNKECQHNSIYWSFQNYIGLGAGSFSFLNKKRFCFDSDIKKYISNNKIKKYFFETYDEYKSEEKYLRDVVAFGLRMLKGVDLRMLQKQFDVSCKTLLYKVLQNFFDDKLIVIDNNKIKLTDRGIYLYDEIAKEIIL